MGTVVAFNRESALLHRLIATSHPFAPFIHARAHKDTHMAKLTQKASPTVAPAATTKVVLKDTTVTVTSAKLDSLLDTHLAVCAKIAQLTAKKKEVEAEILGIHKKKNPDGKRIQTDDFTAVRVPAENHYTDPKMLLQLGVKASVIQKATKTTPYEYVRITRRAADAAAVADLDE